MNVTSPSFKNFLSTASVDDNDEWCDAPLFPAIFKKAGYNVVFYSNQFVKSPNMEAWDASCGFFNHPEIEPMLFTCRNSQKFEYDEQLINDYKKNRKVIEVNDKPNLILFHLMGQHMAPAKRIPNNFKMSFVEKDYTHRTELTPKQRQEVADYDNATLYNDSIVYEIINMYKDKDALVLYFADHGEEANDYRPHVGRCRGIDRLGAPCLHCQLDIPFIIYVSDTFKENHTALNKKIEESTNRPFMTDDLPHVLYDIASIKTDYFNPNRCLINDKFNSSRKRIIKGFSVSRPIDYDNECKKSKSWKIGYNKE